MRVSTSELAAFLGITDSGELIQYIEMASVLSSDISGLTEQRMILIDKFLSAHFYKINYPDPIEDKIDNTAQRWDYGKVGEGLMATRYGKQAIAFDTTGTLAVNAGGVKKAYLGVITNY